MCCYCIDMRDEILYNIHKKENKMFSAMVLACVLNADGTSDPNNCRGFVSPYIWENVDQCMQALQYGIAEVDNQGWAVIDYQCFNWQTKEGIPL